MASLVGSLLFFLWCILDRKAAFLAKLISSLTCRNKWRFTGDGQMDDDDKVNETVNKELYDWSFYKQPFYHP